MNSQWKYGLKGDFIKSLIFKEIFFSQQIYYYLIYLNYLLYNANNFVNNMNIGRYVGNIMIFTKLLSKVGFKKEFEIYVLCF